MDEAIRVFAEAAKKDEGAPTELPEKKTEEEIKKPEEVTQE